MKLFTLLVAVAGLTPALAQAPHTFIGCFALFSGDAGLGVRPVFSLPDCLVSVSNVVVKAKVGFDQYG